MNIFYKQRKVKDYRRKDNRLCHRTRYRVAKKSIRRWADSSMIILRFMGKCHALEMRQVPFQVLVKNLTCQGLGASPLFSAGLLQLGFL